MKWSSALVAILLGPAWAADSRAQQVRPTLETAATHVVKLSMKGGGTGAGIIVARSGSRIHIVTAKHNITGDPPVNPCGRQAVALLAITYYWSQDAPVSSAAAVDCHATLDLAVIQADLLPNTPATRVPPLPLVTLARLLNGFNVSIIGHPADSSWKVAKHEINQVKGTFFREEAEAVPLEETGITSARNPVNSGYSGGAVVDDSTGALAGMILLARAGQAIFLRWDRISDALDNWAEDVRIPHDLVIGEVPPANPAFATGAQPATSVAEDVRSVLVRYIEALRARSLPAVRAARPDVNGAEFSALFGDATSVELILSNCGLVTVNGPDDAQIKCAYAMTVQRRTGDTRSENVPEATFLFKRKLLSWAIAGLK